MKVLESIGRFTLNLIIGFWNIFSAKNRPKELKLFLFNRDIEYIDFHGRVFINGDKGGEEFLNSLSNHFRRYDKTNEKQAKRYRNQFITFIAYDPSFEFEFIDPKYWEHFKLAVSICKITDADLCLDAVFYEIVQNVDPTFKSVKFKEYTIAEVMG